MKKLSSMNFAAGTVLVLSLAALKLLIHLLTANRYGIFRDELYHLACAEHLDSGYVDQFRVFISSTFRDMHAERDYHGLFCWSRAMRSYLEARADSGITGCLV